MRRDGAPLRFILTVMALWGGGRAVWLMSGFETAAIASRSESSGFIGMVSGASSALPVWLASSTSVQRPSPMQLTLALPPPAPATDGQDFTQQPYLNASLAASNLTELALPLSPATPAPRLDLDQAVNAASRWSGSAWVFVRDRSRGRSLAALGQLGGSQAGAVARWRINPGSRLRTAIYGRVSTPLENHHGAEGAVGLEWHPLPGQPVWVAAERRIAFGNQGRDAWSAYVAGGFWRSGLPLNLTVDAYAQAGVVGVKRRDLFADGAARMSRPIAAEGSPRIGAGVWAAAQPGVARVDIGPHARLPLKVSGQPFSISADYRVRVAGDARPGSGVAVTLASDF